ncbi:MAG: hypothetical protein HC833_13120 [Leptolyngbyaceae cyanobacterium RM1_406_9]|nr:hypothetical protein [Leptolyngbyaceae cyanobacterium RM1_406_9]
MTFDLSPHLYKRLELRKIPLQVLEAVLETPEQVLIQEDGMSNAYCTCKRSSPQFAAKMGQFPIGVTGIALG